MIVQSIVSESFFELQFQYIQCATNQAELKSMVVNMEQIRLDRPMSFVLKLPKVDYSLVDSFINCQD